LCAGVSDRLETTQSGWYLQGVYQFTPGWRVGLRYDRLDSGSQSLGAGYAGVLSTEDSNPSRWSLMADYSPSEFSRFRVQYARDESMQDIVEDQWTVQYVMSLGAHGAHMF
jgi:outer membrane receptor protein involved in Fe transport